MTGVGDTPRDFREFIVDTRKRLVSLERRQSAPAGTAYTLPSRLGGDDGDLPSLGAGVNLNTLVVTGWYIQDASANATLALNYPVTRAGHLEVSGGLMGVGTDFVLQTYTEYAPTGTGLPARKWERTQYNGVWQPWNEIVSADAYRLSQTVYFRASGAFIKASYPGLLAVRVRVQAGGGSGGGAAAAASGQNSYGSGGGGGGYAESFILASALGGSVAVTVGAGAVGAPAASDGGSGQPSSFGTAVVATGGTGGYVKASSTLGGYTPGGEGGVGTAGDLLLSGSGGSSGWGAGTLAAGGVGGGSIMGGGGRSLGSGGGAAANAGPPGGDYGGGGGGAAVNAAGVARTGGPGGPGIVIVDLYR